MRRYWTISLSIGGGAAAVALALLWTGAFEVASEWLWRHWVARGWAEEGAAMRLRPVEILTVCLAGFGVAWGIVEATRIWQKAFVAVLAMAAAALLAPALALYGLRFDPFATLAAAALAAVGGFLFARTEEGRRKRLLEDALGLRVSASVFAELLEAPPRDPGMAGTAREVTTLVCRLFPPEGAKASESPVDLMKVGSLFARSVSAFLVARGAYVEEVGPERVRASFGMLRDEEDHAERACRAALDLRGRLKGLAKECESRWFLPLRGGIGIGSGTMAVGLCGTPGRHFLAGLGGEADFADRLALANARFGSDVLIGPGVYRLVRERFEVRPLEMLYDPMAQALAEIYELLAPAESFAEGEKSRRDCFWRGVVHLRSGDCEAALEQFSRARVPGGEDAPLAYLTGCAQEGLAQPESRPSRLLREFTEEGHARLAQRL